MVINAVKILSPQFVVGGQFHVEILGKVQLNLNAANATILVAALYLHASGRNLYPETSVAFDGRRLPPARAATGRYRRRAAAT